MGCNLPYSICKNPYEHCPFNNHECLFLFAFLVAKTSIFIQPGLLGYRDYYATKAILFSHFSLENEGPYRVWRHQACENEILPICIRENERASDITSEDTAI